MVIKIKIDLNEKIEKIKGKFSRQSLFVFCEMKGFPFKNKITLRSPTREEVVDIIEKKNRDYIDQLLEILELNRYLKPEHIQTKADELGVYQKDQKRIISVIKIYCKSPDEMRRLSQYRSIDPSRSMFSSNTVQLTIKDFMDKQEEIRKLVKKQLSKGEDSIVTLDKVSQLGDKVRFEVHYDQKKKVKERKPSPEFPGRAGPFREIYPESKMYVEYDIVEKKLKVSATKRAQEVLEVFSTAILGKKDAIKIEKPKVEKIYENITKEDVRRQLQTENVKVTEIELAKLPMRGSPSYMQMKGNNLLETFDQFKEHKLPIFGKGLSELRTITVYIGKNKVMIDYVRGNQERTKRISDEQSKHIDSILSNMGIL